MQERKSITRTVFSALIHDDICNIHLILGSSDTTFSPGQITVSDGKIIMNDEPGRMRKKQLWPLYKVLHRTKKNDENLSHNYQSVCPESKSELLKHKVNMLTNQMQHPVTYFQ